MKVTVGICAFNEAHPIGACLQSLLLQRIPPDFELIEIVVVASGCTDGTERVVREWQDRDPRILLVHEPRRRGKASGLNEIFRRAQGEIIAILNADAVLHDDALTELLHPFASDPGVMVACGAPVPDSSSEGVMRVVADFHWELHNRTLDTLSRRSRPNHCCDEFMALRHGFVTSLPSELVNDGAYIGALASLRGISVRFCPEARVSVAIPKSLHGLLRQRRRILRGHSQVEALLGRSPNTFAKLLTNEPALAIRVTAGQILSQPARVLALLLVIIPLETWAVMLAARDRVLHLRYEPVWHPVE